jgi:hypothetical protein
MRSLVKSAPGVGHCNRGAAPVRCSAEHLACCRPGVSEHRPDGFFTCRASVHTPVCSRRATKLGIYNSTRTSEKYSGVVDTSLWREDTYRRRRSSLRQPAAEASGEARWSDDGLDLALLPAKRCAACQRRRSTCGAVDLRPRRVGHEQAQQRLCLRVQYATGRQEGRACVALLESRRRSCRS